MINRLNLVPFYRESNHYKSFIWLVEGSFRVFKSSSVGREVTLYRVYPGDLCVLNLHCLLTNEKCFANAIAETELTAFILSKEEFYHLVDESNEFQRYLLKVMSQSLCDIVRLVADISFKQINDRLSCLLKKLFRQSSGEPLIITHIKLAKELGTTREVISRALKEMENQQCISLSRGEIKLLSLQSMG